MKRLLLSGAAAIARLIVQAPSLNWIPCFSKENKTAQNLIITPDARKYGLPTAIDTGAAYGRFKTLFNTQETCNRNMSGKDAAFYFQRKSLV